MTDLKTCPQCGSPLAGEVAQGLCRACLLKLGLDANSIPSTDAEGYVHYWTPPNAVDLTDKFPALEILELIGRGGMGAVYKARQKELDRLVAVKILPPGIGADPTFSHRFAREAKALAKLNHPNIVTIHEFGQADGLYFFIMEYVDGVNLRQLLNAGRIASREALTIVPQICDALQFAHDHGVVHRDIKPENILLDRQGHVKVADFGIAKIVEREDPAQLSPERRNSASMQTTDAGQVMGTPQYMAPEQIEHPADVDHRADIYSLGVMFYQMLTGELPSKRIEPPSKKVLIDVRLDEVVLRALEKDPQRRYQHVSEVKTQVELIMSNPRQVDEFPRGGLHAPLKVSGHTYFTTPEHLATFTGGFWWPYGSGELALYEDRLIFSRGWPRTEIPFGSLEQVGVARFPRWMSPLGHQLLFVIYDEKGQRKTLLLLPGNGWFRTAGDTSRYAAEWIIAIRDTVKAATKRDLPCGINEPTVVPASPWATLLVFAPLLLVFGLCIWQLFVVRAREGFMPSAPMRAAPVHRDAPIEAPATLAADQAKTDLDRMQGSWRVVSSQVGFEKASEEEVKNRKVTVNGNTLIYETGNELNEKREGTIKLDPTTGALDWTVALESFTALGIYELNGDTLKIGFGNDGLVRPKRWEIGKENVVWLLVLKNESQVEKSAPSPANDDEHKAVEAISELGGTYETQTIPRPIWLLVDATTQGKIRAGNRSINSFMRPDVSRVEIPKESLGAATLRDAKQKKDQNSDSFPASQKTLAAHHRDFAVKSVSMTLADTTVIECRALIRMEDQVEVVLKKDIILSLTIETDGDQGPETWYCYDSVYEAPLAPSADSAGQKKDKEAVQGMWRIVSSQHTGNTFLFEEDPRGLKVVATGDTLAYHSRDEQGRYEGRFQLDPVNKAFDWSPAYSGIGPSSGATIPFRGIYELKGDELKIYFDESKWERPKTFDFKEGWLLVLKRPNP